MELRMEEKQLNGDLLADCIDLLITKMAEAPQPVKTWTLEEQQELYSSAYHFYQSGKYQEAVDFFRTLTTIDPNDTAYWLGLAGALKMQMKYERALEAYTIAALLNSNDPYTHAHAADCCFAIGEIERGMMALSSAETIAANDEKYKGLVPRLEAIRLAWTKKDKINIE